MIDRIDRNDRVERRVFKLEGARGIGMMEANATIEPLLCGHPSGVRDATFVLIDTDYLAAHGACQKKRRAARPASDVQNIRGGRKPQPFEELAILICRQPA